MAAWEYVLLGVASLIAMSTLSQLMRAKRSKLVAELQQQAERQRQSASRQEQSD